MATIHKALALAVEHHQRGELSSAEAIYRQLLASDPRQPDALHLLGVLMHQSGRNAEAIDLITQAIAINDQVAEFHGNLGVALSADGRRADAIACYEHAIQLMPDYADAHSNLGDALRRQGDVAQAVHHCREAIRIAPTHVSAHCNLGTALVKNGKLPEALGHFRESLRLSPNYVEAHRNLGFALAACEHFDEAIGHFQQALALKPNHAQTHYRLAIALKLTGRTAQALAHFLEVLRLRGESVETLNCLGETLLDLGRTDDAVEYFEKALRLEPHNAIAWSNLGYLAQQHQYEFSSEQIQQIEALARESTDRAAAAGLYYTLTGVYALRQDYDAAFAACDEANARQRQSFQQRKIAFDPQRHASLVKRIIASFDAAYFERVAAHGIASELPVFIVGMPRSGTTLVEQILDSHPQIHGAGELVDLEQLAATLARNEGFEAGYPEGLVSAKPLAVGGIARRHLEKLTELSDGAARVVDKLPTNFLRLGLIATLFPQARVIHCRRDPLDVCLSCYFQNFSAVTFAASLADLGSYYRQYELLMNHWTHVLPLSIHEVVYEQLVADPETESRKLIEFCGLPWSDDCLRFHENDRPVQTASRLQVRRPVYASSVRRAERYRRHLGELTEALGEAGPK